MYSNTRTDMEEITMIICIEGITNSGKSSLCNIIEKEQGITLINKLQKESFIAQKIKPITGPVENIDKFDDKIELLLYSTLLSDKAGIASLTNGDILLDRFSLSVYSFFKAKYGLEDYFLKPIVEYSSRGIMPDITFFLDVSLNTIMQRKINSPFTRKDIGLENYYAQLRMSYIDNINTFSKKSYVIDCNDISTIELYHYVCKCMDWS